jgi:excisionase family DNA binding protein
MEFVHIDSEAFKKLKKQLDNIEREIRKLRDPVQVVSSEWLTIDEAAQALRVTKRTVFKYLKNGDLTCNRISRKAYFHIDDLRQLLEEKKSVQSKTSNRPSPGTVRQQ